MFFDMNLVLIIRRLNLVLLSTCFTVVTIAAFKASAVPGFLKIGDNSIPQAVKEASKAVFRIYSQGGKFDQSLNMADATTVQAARELLKDDRWELMQIEYCEKHKIQICHLFVETGQGTLFLAKNQNTGFTNLHNFFQILSKQVQERNSVTRTEINDTLNLTPLFFGTTDTENQFNMFNPKTDFAQLIFFNPDVTLFDGTKEAMLKPLGRLSDVLQINFSKPHQGSFLKIADKKPKVGDKLYLIGFPIATGDRKLLGVEDSDGTSISFSAGKMIDVSTWSKLTGNSLNSITLDLFDRHMILADFDCEHGNSGGPILNEQGEVVGIMMALWKDITKTPSPRICGGLNSIDRLELDSLWQSLAQ